MKRAIRSLVLLLALLPALTACGHYDYSVHISEIRSDIFCAETEEFTVTVTCISREYPYVSDGIACPMSNVVEISLIPVSRELTEYSVYLLGETVWGGETTFRTFYGDHYYSQGVTEFPSVSVTIKVEWEEESREITATSVKNEATLTAKEALSCAIESEKETIEHMTTSNGFNGEFYVRLLRRDANYYYVGIVDRDGKTISLLLDSESGEVLARRESR